MNESAVLFQDGDKKFNEPYPRTSRKKMKYSGILITDIQKTEKSELQ